jgi:hypothetical protein
VLVHTPPRPGRKPAANPKTDVFAFRLTPGERQTIATYAARKGLSLSDAIRGAALAAAALEGRVIA